MKKTVLVVDDEPTQRRLIEYVVGERLGYHVVPLAGGQEAIDYVLSGRQPEADLMLLDLAMPKVSGMDVIRAIRPLRPQLPMIVLTMHGDLEKAIEAVKAGATDFLAKPVPMERLSVSLQNALKLSVLNEEVTRLRRSASGQVLFSDMIGTSVALREVIALGQRAAAASIPVMIEGESGTGKKYLARAIHGSGDRAGKPFVSADLASVPPHFVASILFGHEKGAFPGAIYRTMGKCREADGGTLFISGIETLSAEMQGKLLRLVQEGMIEPVGGRDPVKVNVRVICASNGKLHGMVQAGQFREDLFFRISVLTIRTPSLRERREDIARLAEHFIERYAMLENRHVRGISPDAVELLLHHPWSGNIRELENAIFRAVVMCDGDTLSAQDFAPVIAGVSAASRFMPPQQQGMAMPHSQGMRLPANGNASASQGNGHAGFRSAAPLQNAMDGAIGAVPGMMGRDMRLSLVDGTGNVRQIAELEAELIQFALKHYDGHISEAARRLGIGRSTLYRKLSDFGIDHHRMGSGE